jgi:glycosyltransferase involved in cell wall biosynthesis
VLTIIHLYPPHHLGGYEVACQGAMERFCERGHDVLVLTGAWRSQGVEEFPPPEALEVRRELQGWWDFESWSPLQPSLPERIRIERRNQRALHRAWSSFRPDVASVWDLGMMSWSIGTLLERRSAPIVLTFLDDWITFAYAFDAWTRMFDRRPWARPAGALLGLETRLPTFRGAVASVASRMIGDSIERNGRWQFPNAALVPIGVDTRDFPVSAPEARPWSWRILYVGRVVPQKGVPTMVKALAQLPSEARLDVVGHAHPKEQQAMTDLAADHGVVDRVEFSLASSRDDLRTRYRQADLVVFPSEWPEPFGIVPLEAMACGVPVIATGTGGSGEFLEDGTNCLLFRPGDPDDLATAALRVAEDRHLRTRLVAGGTETARRLTMDRFADELERLHVEAIEAGSSPRSRGRRRPRSPRSASAR